MKEKWGNISTDSEHKSVLNQLINKVLYQKQVAI